MIIKYTRDTREIRQTCHVAQAVDMEEDHLFELNYAITLALNEQLDKARMLLWRDCCCGDLLYYARVCACVHVCVCVFISIGMP